MRDIENIRQQSFLPQVELRKALIANGIYPPQIDALIENITPESARETARAEWEYAQNIYYNHPLVASIAAALNKSQADIDKIFGL
jgi:predicted urease superfamily metal-dependent hydrolase